MAESAPVSLVCGPGRGTLLRHLLDDPRLRRAAFLLGEGGGVSGHPGVRRYAAAPGWAPGGCACCAPRGDLARAVRSLLPMIRRGEVDRVLIEAADPLPALAAVIGDAVLASICHPAGVVTVLRRGDGEAFRRQVAVADTVVVEGGVLPAPDLAAQVVDPQAALRDPAVILGVVAPAWRGGAAWGGTGVLCRGFELPVDRDALRTVLQGMLRAWGGGLLRIRGILPAAGGAVLVQGVGHLLHGPLPLPSAGQGGGDGWLACAFQGLDPARVAAGLAALTPGQPDAAASRWPPRHPAPPPAATGSPGARPSARPGAR